MMKRAPWVVLTGLVLLCSCSTNGDDVGDASPDGGDGGDSGLDGASGGDADEEQAADGDVEPETGTDAESDVEDVLPLEWETCDVSDWPEGYPLPSAGTECTSMDVPVDHADPSGPHLALHIARQQARDQPGNRAVFVMEGGPGGASFSISGMVPDAVPDLRDGFDLIYVDQRGTGGSGYLGCSISPRTESEWFYCADEQGETELQHYLSEDVARDLDAVRARLGYEEIYLYGFSYGTRIAFEYMRLFEDRVVAAVLDGVAPPSVDLFSDTITAFGRGVDLLVRDCEASPECLEVSPNLEEDLEQRLVMLRETPRSIVVGGNPMIEDDESYQSLLEAFLRYSYWRYRVPRAVHLAMEGNNSVWNRMMSEAIGAPVNDGAATPPRTMSEPIRVRWVMDSLGPAEKSPIVHAVMLCAEILPNSPGVEALNELHLEQMWPNERIVAKMNTCSAWSLDPLPESQRQLYTGDVPILLVSGAIDINVDPRWAFEALDVLSNATHILVPYQTHLATYVPCVGDINAAFLAADGDLSSVDISCLDSLQQPEWD